MAIGHEDIDELLDDYREMVVGGIRSIHRLRQVAQWSIAINIVLLIFLVAMLTIR